MSSLPRTDCIPQVHCGKCRWMMKAKRNAEEEEGKGSLLHDPQQKQTKIQQQPDSSLGEGLLDLPPTTQLRLQRRLQRSRSRSGSPCIESVRRLVIRNHYPNQQQQQQQFKPQKKEDVPVDDRMRIDCNRIGKHDCRCNKEDESSSSSSIEQQSPKLQQIGHGDRWGHDLERGRSGREGTDPLVVGGERGRSRRSRKDGFEDDKSTSPVASTAVNSTGNKSKSVPTSDDKLRFQRSLNSAASLLFHTAAGCSSPGDLGAKGQLHGRRFTLNKFLRAPPLRMSSSPLLGSFEVTIFSELFQKKIMSYF